MPEPAAFLTFVLTSIILVIVPGPTVTLIIANSLRHGTRAGLINVAGTQAGLAVMLVVLAAGLSTLIASLGVVFDWLKLAGAAYLIWLGWKLWQADGSLVEGSDRPRPNGSFFWQGFIVILSNPKVLVLFGALIPQFIDPAGDPLLQTLVLGATFMIVATIFDSAYAVLAGRAGGMLSRGNVRLVERLSGSFLIAGGIWLALQRR
jgi:threonine/homoserine/homoserine lactone efflux protein